MADTGPLYAASDPNDSFYARSLEEQERLEAEDLETAVSYATVQEAISSSCVSSGSRKPALSWKT